MRIACMCADIYYANANSTVNLVGRYHMKSPFIYCICSFWIRLFDLTDL